MSQRNHLNVETPRRCSGCSMSQSYSHQNYPHTPANRFSPPDRHQPYDSYGFQTQTNTRTSSVLIQQHAQSRPGAISPIQRERRPLPSPEMHGHHALTPASDSTWLPTLGVNLYPILLAPFRRLSRPLSMLLVV